MNNLFENKLNTANIGYCISEKMGIYIANNFICGFKYHNIKCKNVITLYTINYSFDIYVHDNEYLDFVEISKKIITRILNSIRYDITTNIDIDKIVNEVIKDVC